MRVHQAALKNYCYIYDELICSVACNRPRGLSHGRGVTQLQEAGDGRMGAGSKCLNHGGVFKAAGKASGSE